MQPATGNNDNGFTLVELMLVMAIIALIATSVMFTLPSSTPSERSPQDIAVTLKQQLQFAREQAMVRQQPMGVLFQDQQYQFVRWQDNQWQSLSSNGLKGQQLQPELTWRLEPVNGGQLLQQQEDTQNALFQPEEDQREGEQEPVIPQIMIFPSGEITAFSLQLDDPRQLGRSRWLVATSAWQIEIREQADAPR